MMDSQVIAIYMDLLRPVINRIGNRKLVFRWKCSDIEDAIFNEFGLKADFYVTRNKARIDNVNTFSDEVLRGNSHLYYLLIFPELKWNDFDYKLYSDMGYSYEDDFLWLTQKPKLLSFPLDEFYGGGNKYIDIFGNTINSFSNALIEVCGINSFVEIGKNVVLPKTKIRIGNNVKLIIKDNSLVKPAYLTLVDGSSLFIGEKCEINGLGIFINSNSSVEIGKKTTMQTGKLRTGRNQSVKIGEDCMFSWEVVFLPHDGHLIWDVNSGQCLNNTTGPQRESVILGDHVWIGGETVFMPNTVVGSGSICGYRSLVKGRIPNNCVVAGQPARVIKRNITWSRNNVSFDEMADYKAINEKYRQMTIEEE